jgi:hypothetical protein
VVVIFFRYALFFAFLLRLVEFEGSTGEYERVKEEKRREERVTVTDHTLA